MENNQPVQPQPVQSPQPATPIANPPTPSGSSKKGLMVVLILVVLLLLAFGGYLLFMNKDLLFKKPMPQTPQAATPSFTTEDLDSDLNKVTVESIDSDFAQVDTDLQGL